MENDNIIYHFDCDCNVPKKDIIKYHWDRETDKRSNRAHCPDHLDARLINKTVICQCGCGRAFDVGPKCNNARYHPECGRAIKLQKTAAWHKKHRPIAYVVPPKISPIQRNNKPFEPGDVGIEFPTGLSPADLAEIMKTGIFRARSLRI